MNDCIKPLASSKPQEELPYAMVETTFVRKLLDEYQIVLKKLFDSLILSSETGDYSITLRSLMYFLQVCLQVSFCGSSVLTTV